MKTSLITSLVLSSSIALASGSAMAYDNPFSANALDSGYQLAQVDTKTQEGKCGEGKCGESKRSAESKKAKEGKCGEGKCGESKRGAENKKAKEGKCGEGKCGESKRVS